ncbi:hypothetical protein B0H15DRAFT_774611 [Mycena belliarum]|uniref:Small ribosomal subunit protein mS41 n=1 Tax=Mycena belliarum TaxID=1033014 RepID=A0AAD6XQE1_9AGAR|nr:hypothetical protein B0H15DRAFT_774611 [Mycena belliae]
MNTLFSSGARLCALVPRISRSLATTARPIPDPRGTHLLLTTVSDVPLTQAAGSIDTPGAFLKAIGRSADAKLSIENWGEFWQQTSPTLKSAGVGVRERRYILWCMEKYRSGIPVEEFVHDQRPKKTVRGWGPTVQHGKRIRSRRDRTKKSKP